MPCKACQQARTRRKARLEARQRAAAKRQEERIQRAAQAQQNMSKTKFTDINGANG